MRRLAYRFFICTLALAFVVSGATWRQCATVVHGPAAPNSAPQHANLAHHDHTAAQHAQAADDAHHADHAVVATQIVAAMVDLPTFDDHLCQKCCGLCTVASLLPIAPNPAVVFTVTHLSFSLNGNSRPDRVIHLDPGIPKPLA